MAIVQRTSILADKFVRLAGTAKPLNYHAVKYPVFYGLLRRDFIQYTQKLNNNIVYAQLNHQTQIAHALYFEWVRAKHYYWAEIVGDYVHAESLYSELMTAAAWSAPADASERRKSIIVRAGTYNYNEPAEPAASVRARNPIVRAGAYDYKSEPYVLPYPAPKPLQSVYGNIQRSRITVLSRIQRQAA
ncbi:MAG: hypothetical protein LBQ49_02035 [Rickettsiales bacterium]|jgi:hypothetical protein|nr:hypothetical protein [Rickettsiales bacterium]